MMTLAVIDQTIQIIFNVPLRFIFVAVPEIQVGAIFIIFIPLPPMLYLFCHTVRRWVFSTLTSFEYSPGFDTEEFLYPIELNCWPHGNFIMFVGYHSIGFIRLALYFRVCYEN